MRIGIASDHAGFELKKKIKKAVRQLGHTVVDYGPSKFSPQDDYPDYVWPLARGISQGKINRGIAICGSGVGACITANKMKGVRAGLVSDYFSAHQGVEDDDMNVICFGAKVINSALAWDLTQAFLSAQYIKNESHQRRLMKIESLEQSNHHPRGKSS